MHYKLAHTLPPVLIDQLLQLRDFVLCQLFSPGKRRDKRGQGPGKAFLHELLALCGVVIRPGQQAGDGAPLVPEDAPVTQPLEHRVGGRLLPAQGFLRQPDQLRGAHRLPVPDDLREPGLHRPHFQIAHRFTSEVYYM